MCSPAKNSTFSLDFASKLCSFPSIVTVIFSSLGLSNVKVDFPFPPQATNKIVNIKANKIFFISSSIYIFGILVLYQKNFEMYRKLFYI